jgi:hypothetical protein
VHLRQIDDEAIIVYRIARDIVTTATDRQEQIVIACEVHGGDDIGRTAALHDQRRSPVDEAILDRPRIA